MFKNLFILTCVLLLSNCTTPTSAFLGPIFTGAKTGSVYQASISYSSSKIMNTIRKNTMNNLTEFNRNYSTESTLQMPVILATNKIYPIYLSEVEIIEPLP